MPLRWPLAEEEQEGAVRRLNEAGVPCGVLVAPVLPGLPDGEEQERLASLAADALRDHPLRRPARPARAVGGSLAGPTPADVARHPSATTRRVAGGEQLRLL